MKFSDEQICIVALFLLGAGSLIGSFCVNGSASVVLASNSQNVICGLLGFLTKGIMDEGKE